MKNYKAIKITVSGRVQGVGFRPFVFSLANQYGIKGTVQNNMSGVKIWAEGTLSALRLFVKQLKSNQPRLARVDQLSFQAAPLKNFRSFFIIKSNNVGSSELVIPIDAAVCNECLLEMEDQTNFRYQYPFINCTQCGPRYTIIKELPYDRNHTSMAEFDMCFECNKEYQDPKNHRHHAEPIACTKCGPTVSLFSSDASLQSTGLEAIEQCRQLLAQGKIVAIKGIGGYHLACDAFNETSVTLLRKRKKRPTRPLAVMANELATIEKIAILNEVEKQVLRSPESPIVVVKSRKNNLLSDNVGPGMNTIGVFLPYTPLHKLLFKSSAYDTLIMTSANPSGLPMLYNDREAFDYLEEIADYVLTSNRAIEHPIDDSVVQIVNNEIQFFRRARGYVPDPYFTEENVHNVIALGAQQKITFAIGRQNQIFIGSHIGDMGSIEVTNHFLSELNHLMKWLGVKRKVIVVDKHPNYETSLLAKDMNAELLIQVQHHHAHHAACMAENRLKAPCFGIILDGTGYGDDGNIWGFELLYGDASMYKRLGHLSYWALPGGEKAVKEPWRNAAGLVISHCDGAIERLKNILLNKNFEIDTIREMINRKINSPMAGTCGRLFDAVSALIGLCHVSTYDGEAAIRLSELVDETDWVDEYYPFTIVNQNGLEVISLKPMIAELISDIEKQLNRKMVALKFHRTIVEMGFTLINEVKGTTTLNKQVVLSGGSFHNRFLLHHLKKRLEENGYQVFTHKRFPCNDGGISLGQLVVASAQVNKIGESNFNVCRSTSKSN